MVNFKSEILKYLERHCDGETVEKILLNRLSNTPLDWEDVEEFLDYEYDDGFGSAECDAIYIWTENYLVGVSEYDGATSIVGYPRNPVACRVEYF